MLALPASLLRCPGIFDTIPVSQRFGRTRAVLAHLLPCTVWAIGACCTLTYFRLPNEGILLDSWGMTT